MPKADHEPNTIVYVNKGWYEKTLGHLVGDKRGGEEPLQILIGDLKDAGDPRGLWLQRVTTRELRDDRSEVALTFLIPWQYVQGLGVADDGGALPIGFTGRNVTVLE